MIIHLAYTKAWGGARVWSAGGMCRSLVVQRVVVRRVCSAEGLGGQALVVSRLALRWGAKRPRLQAVRCFSQKGGQDLGLLRSPTRGKPARHKKAGSPLSTTSGFSTKSWLSTTSGFSTKSGLFTKCQLSTKSWLSTTSQLSTSTRTPRAYFFFFLSCLSLFSNASSSARLMVRSTFTRAQRLSLASTNVQGETSVLVRSTMSPTAAR